MPLPLVAAGLLASPLGTLLVAVVVLAAVVFVGRIVLDVAWKLLVVAAVVVGLLYVLSLLGV